MKFGAVVLKQNPMLIQKIIAERLSDKLQIMMVPGRWEELFCQRRASLGVLGSWRWLRVLGRRRGGCLPCPP
jgi:hypothetical protein